MNIYSTLIVRMQIAEANAKKVLECFSPNKMHHWLFMKRARRERNIDSCIIGYDGYYDFFFFLKIERTITLTSFPFFSFFFRAIKQTRRLDYITRLRHPRVASPIRSN